MSTTMSNAEHRAWLATAIMDLVRDPAIDPPDRLATLGAWIASKAAFTKDESSEFERWLLPPKKGGV